MTRDEFFFLLAMARAHRLLKKRRCNVHVFRDRQGFVVTEFIPVCEQRKEWVRVCIDGRIEEGKTGRKLGALREFWPAAQHMLGKRGAA